LAERETSREELVLGVFSRRERKGKGGRLSPERKTLKGKVGGALGKTTKQEKSLHTRYHYSSAGKVPIISQKKGTA